MTGVDVASLAPFRGGRGAAKLGLKPLDPAQWLDRSPHRQPRAAAKAAVFGAFPESLIETAGGEAVAELAALIGARGHTLRDAALATYEDLCILERRGGAHVFVAGALAYPTDWRLHEKIGHPLSEIHAPVAGYAKLSAGVDHVFATLTPDRLLTRANWNIVESDVLRYLPTLPAALRFGHVSAANAGTALYLRIERQTLRRLPVTQAAVFAIGVYIEPLGALPPAVVHDLAAAVLALPVDEAARRGTAGYAAALTEYAYGRRVAIN